MAVFSTEFPVSPLLNRSKLVAETVAWVRGIDASGVLVAPDEEDLGDEIRLSVPSGEKLVVRAFGDEEDAITAIRHVLPDREGRLWKTELVHSRVAELPSINIRSECIATRAGAIVSRPLRPHIIRQLVEEGYGGIDGGLMVQAKPHVASGEIFELLVERLQGRGFGALPVVFVSRDNDGRFAIKADRLAIDLAGIAHVIVEESRSASFDLMAKSFRQNAYGGAIGIYVAGRGEIKRVFPARNAAWLTKEVATSFRSTRELSLGLDWIGALDLQTRKVRSVKPEPSDEENKELLELYEEELETKEAEVARLKRKVDELEIELLERDGKANSILPAELRSLIGPELYEGEFDDRLLRFLVNKSKDSNEELDQRSMIVVSKIASALAFTGRATGLANQIKQAGKDHRRMAKNLTAVLEGFGYSKRETGPHIVLTPPKNLWGVEGQTLPKTPSDFRSGANKAADIVRDLGLGKLK